ncbi:hypothetical protein WICPIJ_002255 [Wickerhamomyces pijperi]|uniref:CTP-dependent diacylglycerol kinase 1 n=1 Tax=Wickerhamomyces pijperi TaxID=599730 RepID=A0A9P8TPU8_WICPI|nr:hypothetical protein WICPIJ_002255 [Wickerhamomyces pijperi]
MATASDIPTQGSTILRRTRAQKRAAEEAEAELAKAKANELQSKQIEIITSQSEEELTKEYELINDQDGDEEDENPSTIGTSLSINKSNTGSSSNLLAVPKSSTTSLTPDNDFVGSLELRPNSPALGNDYLTAHHVFGDYVRKHEVPRKVFHSSIGFVTLYLYTQGVQIDSFPIWFHTSFAVILGFDLLRMRSRRVNYLYCQLLGFLMREKEVSGFNGVLWYILGLDFAFSFFSKDIAVMAVLLLSWSDTAASTFGRAYGYLTPKIARNKSLAGSLAAFVVGVVSSLIFYGYFIPKYDYVNAPGSIYWSAETSYLNLYTLSGLAGFVAALSEGIDIFDFDDNLTIPVLSSMFFYVVITAFHK